MIYAIHRQTLEHRRYSHRLSWSDDWYLVEADEDGWILWEGGECPLPDDAGCDVKTEYSRTTGCIASGVEWENIIAYRPRLYEPEAPAWDGGLPPVGTKCLGNYTHGATTRWLEVEILRHSDSGKECAVYVPTFCCVGWCHEFLSPTQQAEDEAIEAMAESAGGIVDLEPICRELYAAIRDGKIPGVKLEEASS